MMRYRQLFESNLKMKIMQGSDLLQFLSNHEDENKNWYDRLHYVIPSEMRDETHIVHMDGNLVVSSLGLQINPYDTDILWVKHVTVDEDYRNRGLAKELYQAAIDYAREHSQSLQRSSPSKMGKKYLSKTVNDLKQKNPDVKIIDS
jgi:GNAT superfamily N-acetyltransferase